MRTPIEISYYLSVFEGEDECFILCITRRRIRKLHQNGFARRRRLTYVNRSRVVKLFGHSTRSPKRPIYEMKKAPLEKQTVRE
jgi:hypothetical protein